MDYQPYRNAVYRKVCQHCLDLGANGHCTLTGERECGVELYLEKLVDVVHSVKSDVLEDYICALRREVCSHCKNQTEDGNCRLRNSADCGLNRFFEIIVETVEEVDSQK